MSNQVIRLYEFGPFRLDAVGRVLLRHGEMVPLTPKAFETLLALVERSGSVVSKDELLEAVWPDVFVEEGSLTRNVSVLRKALGATDDGRLYIETVPKRGYRFAHEVRESTAGPELAAAAAQIVAAEPRRRLRLGFGLAVALASIVAVIAVAGWPTNWVASRSIPLVRSIAVLPLENLSGDPAQDYFADGMTEALTTELAKVGALRVTSRTSAIQYRDRRAPLPVIARELGVDAVVEGSVLRSSGRVRITAQLIRASTDEHLWAQVYERDERDVIGLESEIARAIAAEVRVTLTPREQANVASTHTVNPAANDLYLKGLYYLTEGRNRELPSDRREWLHRAVDAFEQAIALDSGFAAPHAGIARAYVWGLSSDGPAARRRGMEEALDAIRLDDSLAEAHAALASFVHVLEWDYTRSEREFRRALELNPSYADAHLGYSLLLSCLQRHEEALAEVHRAEELDPRSITIRMYLGGILLRAGQGDRAIEELQDTLELDANYPGTHAMLGCAYALRGEATESENEFRRAIEASGDEPRFRAMLAWSFAVTGRPDAAAVLVRELEASAPIEPTTRVYLAATDVALGNADRALARLDLVYDEDPAALWWIKDSPQFEGVAADPRYRDLLRRLGYAG